MEVKDAVETFEGSLLILRMAKEGWVVGFSVHPDEAPELLMESRLGTRFQVAVVQIGDDEEPTVPQPPPKQEKGEGAKAVAVAGELCRNKSFQKWMIAGLDFFGNDTESLAAQLLREDLNINSRSELVSNPEAREKLYTTIREWKKDLDEEFNI